LPDRNRKGNLNRDPGSIQNLKLFLGGKKMKAMENSRIL